MGLLDGRVLFTATSPATGKEPWALDRGATSPRPLEIRPGAAGSNPSSGVILGDRAFFFADDGISGRELWSTDGTPAGTRLLLDITPGPAGTLATGPLAMSGGRFTFTVGATVWTSDGSVANTRAAAASAGFDVPVATACDGRLLLSAVLPLTGREPWVLDVGAHANAVGWGCSPAGGAALLTASEPVLGSSLTVRGSSPSPSVYGLYLGVESVAPVARARRRRPGLCRWRFPPTTDCWAPRSACKQRTWTPGSR
jgi:ELWxxDGT repeat protein